MVKGHNKEDHLEKEKKGKGQDGHLTNKKREKISKERKGRHPEDDQSEETKKKNNVK